MNCYDCEKNIPPGSSFCPGCGRDMRKTGARRQLPARIQYPNPESTVSWGDVVSRRQQKGLVTALLILAFFVPAAIVYWFTQKEFVGTVSLIIAGAVFSLIPRTRINQSEYASVAHALRRDGRGTVCIHCGNPGIYTKGQYKSDVKTCSCSKCGEFLYVA